MSFLLDTNILIALADEQHVHHRRANVFFGGIIKQGWATCPVVESGFLRVFGHPNYPGGPGSPEDARIFLKSFCSAPGHQFWPDALSLCEQARFPSLPASKHLTDSYLLALAIHRKGRLASLDRRIDPGLLPGGPEAFHLVPET